MLTLAGAFGGYVLGWSVCMSARYDEVPARRCESVDGMVVERARERASESGAGGMLISVRPWRRGAGSDPSLRPPRGT